MKGICLLLFPRISQKHYIISRALSLSLSLVLAISSHQVNFPLALEKSYVFSSCRTRFSFSFVTSWTSNRCSFSPSNCNFNIYFLSTIVDRCAILFHHTYRLSTSLSFVLFRILNGSVRQRDTCKPLLKCGNKKSSLSVQGNRGKSKI